MKKFLLLFFVLVYSVITFAGPLEDLGITKLDEWSDEFTDKLYEEIGDEWDDAGEKLSASIFRSLTDRDLAEFDLLGGELAFKVKRKAYDNFDIEDSWTVADYFSIPLTVPLYTSASFPVGPANIGVRLSATVGVEAINIRQVNTNHLDLIPKIEWLNKEVGESVKSLPKLGLKSISEDSEDYVHIIDEDEDEGSFIDFMKFWQTQNPQTIARYSSYFNLLTHPLRLPLTAKAVKKMDLHEISTYSLDGAVSLGGHAGWGIEDISVGANLTTYVLGKFKISVWKDSETTAQVKMTRRRTYGGRASLGSRASDFVAFKGFVVYGRTILDLKESVIPFDLSVRKETAKSFDLGYRFDLTSKEGLSAYKKAVFGNFVDAERLSDSRNGVEKLFERDERARDLSSNYKMRLAFFIENEHNSNKRFTTARIKMPDGEHRIIKALSTNAEGYDTLWNMSESRSYRFLTTVDKDIYNDTETEGLALRIEGKISDSHTSGKELNSYIEEVEEITGQRNLFPRSPIYDPSISKEMQKIPGYDDRNRYHQNRTASYKRSSFYYTVGFSRSQVEKFRDVDSDEKWAYLEKAFGVQEGAWSSKLKRAWFATKYSLATIVNIPLKLVDLYIKNGGKLIHAKRFYNNWEELAQTSNAEELIKVTADLFATENFSVEFMKVIKHVVADEEISYFISAKCPKTFGKIVRKGSDLAVVDRVSNAANTTINFDSVGSKPIYRTAPVDITNFKVNVIDNKKVEVTFDLTEVPEYIYIRVDKTSSWERFRKLVKAVVANKGENRELFVKGTNHWVISEDEQHPVKKLLADNLFRKSKFEYKTIHMSVSMDQNSWGSVSSQRIKFNRTSIWGNENDKY